MNNPTKLQTLSAVSAEPQPCSPAIMAPAHNKKTPRYLAVHTSLLLMTLLVAGSFPIAAAMMASITLAGVSLGGTDLMLLRFALAALLFAPYVFVVFGWRLPSLAQARVYAALAVPLVVFFCCMFASLNTTTALNTGALFTTVPTFTALFAWWLNREVTGRRRGLGLLLSTFGALWVVFRGDTGALMNVGLNHGDALFLVGCLFLAIYQPLIKRWSLNVPVAVTTFWVIVMSGVWLLLAVILNGLWDTQGEGDLFGSIGHRLLDLPATVYWGLLYLSVFTTLLSFFVQQLGALTIGPARTSAYSLLTPSLVMLISVMIDPSLFAWVLMPGIIMVVLGLLMVQFDQSTTGKAQRVKRLEV